MLAGKGVMRAGEGTVRVGYGSKRSSLKDLRFKRTIDSTTSYGVYSRDNLPNEIKDGAYVINLDEHSDIGTHWIALYVNAKTMTYFDSFRVEHIPKEIKKFINNKKIIGNIFRIQAYDLVMCGYYCIGFIHFMLKSNNLTDFTNLFTPNNFKKNDDIILNYFLTSL